MKRIISIYLLLASYIVGQPTQLNVISPPPHPVSVVSTKVNAGFAGITYYYWVVAVYTRGKANPSPFATAINGPTTITSTNSITVNWTAPQNPGALTYDLLRTNIPALSGTGCTCLVSSGIASTTYTDIGSALTSYTFGSSIPPALGTISLDNLNFSSPMWIFDPALTGGSGSVTTVSITSVNGISGTVANPTTTPAISLTLGAITPTTVNKLTITPPATGSTLTIADGKTFTSSNTIAIAGTDGSTLNVGAGGTLGSNAFTSTPFTPATRNVNTTSPLSGGGALNADLTLACPSCVTAGGTLTANLPVFGGGSHAIVLGTVQGNTTAVVTYAGSAPATNDCAKFDVNGNLTTNGSACGGGGGSGTVTNTGGALTLNLPMFGAGGNDSKVGTLQGNTQKLVSYSGSAPAINDCAKFDASGNVTTAGAACGSGGSGATTASQLLDFSPSLCTTSVSNDSICWNSTASSSNPAVISQNGLPHVFATSGKCQLSGTSNNGIIYFYFNNGQTICGINTSTTVTATGTDNTTASSISAFPVGSKRIATWTYTANVFDSSGKVYLLSPYDVTQLTPGLFMSVNGGYQPGIESTQLFNPSATKLASASGVFATNDCAKFNVNGDLISAGVGCGGGASSSGAVGAVQSSDGSGGFTTSAKSLSFVGVNAPSAPIATLVASAGNVDDGDHEYCISYVTTQGETGCSVASNTITTDTAAHGQVSVTGLGSSCPTGATGKNLYRSAVAADHYEQLLPSMPLACSTTTYTDNTADSGLGAAFAPFVNTTAGSIVNGSTTNTINRLGSSGVAFDTFFGPLMGPFARANYADSSFYSILPQDVPNFLGYYTLFVGQNAFTNSSMAGVGTKALQVATSASGNGAFQSLEGLNVQVFGGGVPSVTMSAIDADVDPQGGTISVLQGSTIGINSFDAATAVATTEIYRASVTIGAGTFSTIKQFSASTPFIDPSAHVTNLIGLNIDNQSGATNNWAIKTGLGKVEFGDLVTAPTLSVAGTSVKGSLTGTTGSIGGGLLTAGTCTSGTVTVTGATTSMAVSLPQPTSYPGDGFEFYAYVSSSNTVTVKVCAIVALTPTATTYTVRVIQ